ncbi:MAG: hypothetical protein SPI26_08720 [Oscillospiraceae bacterium]|nr:hypothetical protein [Oscillospiraceae bacterium]
MELYDFIKNIVTTLEPQAENNFERFEEIISALLKFYAFFRL